MLPTDNNEDLGRDGTPLVCPAVLILQKWPRNNMVLWSSNCRSVSSVHYGTHEIVA